VLVRHVGEGPALGLSVRRELALGYQEGRHEARRHQVEAHDQGRGQEHLARIAYAPFWTLGVVVGVSAYQRHHAHAGLEAGETEGQPGEYEEGDPEHAESATVLPEERALPIRQNLGLRRDLVEADRYDHEVHQQIGPDHGDRDADGLPEALEKDPA
jgi:hypothetical protein